MYPLVVRLSNHEFILREPQDERFGNRELNPDPQRLFLRRQFASLIGGKR